MRQGVCASPQAKGAPNSLLLLDVKTWSRICSAVLLAGGRQVGVQDSTAGHHRRLASGGGGSYPSLLDTHIFHTHHGRGALLYCIC